MSGVQFSHIGIFVHDIARMEAFYTGLLDFTVTDRGQLGPEGARYPLVFLSRDPDEHHQIVLAGGRPETLAFNPINQISLKCDSLETLIALHRRFVEKHAGKLDPVSHGNAVSFYTPDPEGNRLEIYWDTPWYVSQPMRESVDLALPHDELMQRIEAQARALPGFKPRAEWRAEMAARMGLS